MNWRIPYTIVRTEIAKIVFDERRETNPCSLCAKMRKGALNEAIKARCCNKVAYAHHRDDIVETMMMSLVADSLGRPDRYVWGNIFSPCEIMDCFGLNTLSIECLSCYFSGYHLEDFFYRLRTE